LQDIFDRKQAQEKLQPSCDARQRIVHVQRIDSRAPDRALALNLPV
jgi:hypothetical protein